MLCEGIEAEYLECVMIWKYIQAFNSDAWTECNLYLKEQ